MKLLDLGLHSSLYLKHEMVAGGHAFAHFPRFLFVKDPA